MHRRDLDATGPIILSPGIGRPIAVKGKRERNTYVVYGRQSFSELGDEGGTLGNLNLTFPAKPAT